ncbi:hypothetical protein UFOVP1146_66 [uncultured Caudovirales phage]|jgi:hypothetical protein|uniref:Uncharacterized protein n=1 Tax=uncultured Caudovirales phage TaxID=2100421 RepID=A0A6J5P118_9CAUD|nr:hypothetical protein UFOVP812_399 [uncultured Caudovirales phage]CAB4165630.1 hypothetical protein UFOVP818_166 [uncultured Caudovirales phage]CAB4186720.1 hypothetical protein UFOVP1146_66 [uncultured Caudovirales phage]CAB4220882.1 hypothetical protein UFOVP1638_79 [uncultured Caudovirales phage]
MMKHLGKENANRMYSVIESLIKFYRDDYNSYPLRWIVETLAWIATLVNTVTITLTVPAVPWLFCYPLWISACLAYAWSQWTRKSSMGVTSCLAFAALDGIGLTRLLLL